MATDAEIRAKGIKYLPLQKYLQNPYELPVEEETAPVDQGIVNTNAFTNSGDNNFSGYNFDNNSFQNIVDARQKRLNNPSDTFLGFNTRRDQNLTGADLGEYIGSGTNVPQKQTMMGKIQSFLTPQSANEIMADGYQEPRFQPGILATIMGKLDNYRNLRGVDQAFIAQNMGYTGPTVFGENNSGLSKDPFGINTRSAFGNYGEYVGNAVTDLEDALEKAKGKYTNEKGIFNKDLYNKQTKLMQTKLGFYRNKLKEKNLLQKQQEDQAQQEINPTGPSNAPGGTAGGRRDRFTLDEGKTYDNSRGDFRNADGSNVSQDFNNTSASLDNYDASALYAKGGRVGYFFGGRARLQGGGMSQGNESNISQSTNMGGGITGDLSTARQTANHNRAMRDNQKEKPSIIKNIIDTGSELSYLNNLKNLNVPGIALNFGVNKFRNFLDNRKTKEEDKLSYNTNSLPTNNYFADLNAAQIKQLEGPQKMGKEYGNFSDQDILDNITPFGDEETAPATLKDVQTFYGSNGGRAMFKNGGLAGLL